MVCGQWRAANQPIAMFDFFDDVPEAGARQSHSAGILEYPRRGRGCHARSAERPVSGSLRSSSTSALRFCRATADGNVLHEVAQVFTFSTGVSGKIPWPRLKMCPGLRRPVPANHSRALAAPFQSANSSTGSRFPCTAPGSSAISSPHPAECASRGRPLRPRSPSSKAAGSRYRYRNK